MKFFEGLIQFLDLKMGEPELYGWFHIVCLGMMIGATILLCKYGKKFSSEQVRRVIFRTAIIVMLLEIYKQVNYTFTLEEGKIAIDYLWYAFPWQFCSMPMYVGLLCGIVRKGKIHDSLCAFLATYSTFAGLAVMLYPDSVFTEVIGINIQTMVCHGTMVAIGIYLLYIGYVKIEIKTLTRAVPVFLVGISLAMIMNEIAYRVGGLETDNFNMFMISPYLESTLPVYSSVQKIVPYPWCLIGYVGGFTLSAGLVLGIAKFIKEQKRFQ